MGGTDINFFALPTLTETTDIWAEGLSATANVAAATMDLCLILVPS